MAGRSAAWRSTSPRAASRASTPWSTRTSCATSPRSAQLGPHGGMVAHADLAPLVQVRARDRFERGRGQDVIQAPAELAVREHVRAVTRAVAVERAERVAPAEPRQVLDQQQLRGVVALAVVGADLARAGAGERLDLPLAALVGGR